PIVFVQVSDPVGAGFVDNLPRPGGNITGFMSIEYGVSGKWLELLKQIAPRLTRVAVLRNPANPPRLRQFGALHNAGLPLGVELIPVSTRNTGEIERGISAFARAPNSGLIVATGVAPSVHGDAIAALAARHRLPAVYSDRLFVTRGGLISYGPDRVDSF